MPVGVAVPPSGRTVISPVVGVPASIRRSVILLIVIIASNLDASYVSSSSSSGPNVNLRAQPNSISSILAQSQVVGPLRKMETMEPMALESISTATFHIPPDVPSMNAEPVLRFHTINHHPSLVPHPQPRPHPQQLHPQQQKQQQHYGGTAKSLEKSPLLQLKRPPKDFIIYSLPEQSFWPQGHLAGGDDKTNAEAFSSNSQMEGMEGDNGSSSSEEDEDEMTTITTTTNSSTMTATTPKTTSTTTTPAPQQQLETTAEGGSAPTTTTPRSTTPHENDTTRSPRSSSDRDLDMREKKFHLAQCMRYCMDAIL